MSKNKNAEAKRSKLSKNSVKAEVLNERPEAHTDDIMPRERLDSIIATLRALLPKTPEGTFEHGYILMLTKNTDDGSNAAFGMMSNLDMESQHAVLAQVYARSQSLQEQDSQ